MALILLAILVIRHHRRQQRDAVADGDMHAHGRAPARRGGSGSGLALLWWDSNDSSVSESPVVVV
jgi:hypothetical protein